MVSNKLKSIILEQLRIDDWDLSEETTAGTVPGWDSLSHASVIAAVEDANGVRFKSAEIVRLQNLGQLQSLLDQKLKK